MRNANNLEKIESQIMNLPVSEQIHLIERIARRVRFVQTKSESAQNWNDLYGMGKGIGAGMMLRIMLIGRGKIGYDFFHPLVHAVQPNSRHLCPEAITQLLPDTHP